MYGTRAGVQPLLGYCVGAKLWKRFKEVFKFSIIFSLILGVILTIICYLFTNQIVSAFLTNVTAFDYAVQFSKILLTTSFMFGVFYVLTNAGNGSSHGFTGHQFKQAGNYLHSRSVHSESGFRTYRVSLGATGSRHSFDIACRCFICQHIQKIKHAENRNT